MENNGKFKQFLKKKDTRNIIFIVIMSALPIVQFAIFYVYLNFNTFLMAFQTYERGADGIGSYVWCGFDNFRRAFNEFYVEGLLPIELKNTLLYFISSLCVGTALAILFSYYIYKKRTASQVFKIILFLPSIISSITIVLMYKYFMDYAIPNIGTNVFGIEIKPLISTKATSFASVLFYCLWTGFGTGILLYSGAMGSISDSVVEASHLDGASLMQEFLYVTFPCIYPTFATFIIAQLAGLFVTDMALFSFFGTAAERYLWTVGYDLLRRMRQATYPEYPYIASLGMILTLVTIPLTFGVKAFLNKIGPSVE